MSALPDRLSCVLEPLQPWLILLLDLHVPDNLSQWRRWIKPSQRIGLKRSSWTRRTKSVHWVLVKKSNTDEIQRDNHQTGGNPCSRVKIAQKRDDREHRPRKE